MVKPSREFSKAVNSQLPPHSTEAEMGVLGCCLLDAQQCVPICIDNGVGPDTFYDMKHGLIFTALEKMLGTGDVVDVITLQSELKASDTLTKVGGIAYLMSLSDAVPSPANLKYYLEIVMGHATRRALLKASYDIEKLARDETVSASQAADMAEQAVMAADKSESSTELPTMKQLVIKVVGRSEDAMKRDGKPAGLLTGIDELDALIPTGFMPGEMICLAGRPSTGKTCDAMQIAMHIAETVPVGVFSLEMDAESLTARMLANRGRINLTSILTGKLSEHEMTAYSNAAAKVHKLPIHIDDRCGITLQKLRARARRMVSKYCIKFLVIDYLQLLMGSRPDMSDQERVSEVSTGIKVLAKQLKIPILALAQLNREIDKDKPRRPRLSDLRSSGSIEQDSDIIMALWPDQPESDEENRSVMPTVKSILKQRNGEVGDIPMVFFKALMRYEARYTGKETV